MSNYATHLTRAVLALDALKSDGDITPAEHHQLVELLSPAIQRARLVEHLDWLVREHNNAQPGSPGALSHRDQLLDAVDRYEYSRPGQPPQELRLVTRRLEQLDDNSPEILPKADPAGAARLAARHFDKR